MERTVYMGHQHRWSSYTHTGNCSWDESCAVGMGAGNTVRVRAVREGFCKSVKKEVISKEREGQVSQRKNNTEAL